jgi:hypothetical protein
MTNLFPEEPRAAAKPKTEWDEYTVRFGCGGMFGAVVALRWLAGEMHFNVWKALAIIALFGLLAAIFGDKFWESASRGRYRYWW